MHDKVIVYRGVATIYDDALSVRIAVWDTAREARLHAARLLASGIPKTVDIAIVPTTRLYAAQYADPCPDNEGS